MNVILIAGGWSDEREVSLAGAKIIRNSLESLGHTVIFYDPAEDFQNLLALAKKADFAFINLHGTPGEDGIIQAILNQAGCPYQGAGPEASSLALDKAAAKIIFEHRGIKTPQWQFITPVQGRETPLQLEYPVFIKPNNGGSSLGMSLVHNEQQLAPALDKVFAMKQSALVEEFVPGIELTSAILDGAPLPLVMIKPKPDSDFFDYANKYAENGAEEICPAPIEEAITARIQAAMLVAHNALGLAGYSRGDFILSSHGDIYLLEVNTLPGMTLTSLLPKAAQAIGLSYTDLIAKLIQVGMTEKR